MVIKSRFELKRVQSQNIKKGFDLIEIRGNIYYL